MLLILAGIFLVSLFPVQDTNAQTSPLFSAEEASEGFLLGETEDITLPGEEEQEEILTLLSKREISSPWSIHVLGYYVQFAVRSGVPANTVVLILLLPFLATLAAFVRTIVGFPSLEMFVPIALSVTLISTGIFAGAILLLAIVMASLVARILLKRIPIMQIPRQAVSVFIVAAFILVALTVSTSWELLSVSHLSIFPLPFLL